MKQYFMGDSEQLWFFFLFQEQEDLMLLPDRLGFK